MNVAVSFELIFQIIMVTAVSLLPSSGSILQLQYTSESDVLLLLSICYYGRIKTLVYFLFLHVLTCAVSTWSRNTVQSRFISTKWRQHDTYVINRDSSSILINGNYCVSAHLQVPNTKLFLKPGVGWALSKHILAWAQSLVESREGGQWTPILRNEPSTVRSAMCGSTLNCNLNR